MALCFAELYCFEFLRLGVFFSSSSFPPWLSRFLLLFFFPLFVGLLFGLAAAFSSLLSPASAVFFLPPPRFPLADLVLGWFPSVDFLGLGGVLLAGFGPLGLVFLSL